MLRVAEIPSAVSQLGKLGTGPSLARMPLGIVLSPYRGQEDSQGRFVGRKMDQTELGCWRKDPAAAQRRQGLTLAGDVRTCEIVSFKSSTKASPCTG